MLEITTESVQHKLLILRGLIEAGASFYHDAKGRVRVREEDWNRVPDHWREGATVRRLGDWRDKLGPRAA